MGLGVDASEFRELGLSREAKFHDRYVKHFPERLLDGLAFMGVDPEEVMEYRMYQDRDGRWKADVKLKPAARLVHCTISVRSEPCPCIE